MATAARNPETVDVGFEGRCGLVTVPAMDDGGDTISTLVRKDL